MAGVSIEKGGISFHVAIISDLHLYYYGKTDTFNKSKFIINIAFYVYNI
jgi:hypothetical protein